MEVTFQAHPEIVIATNTFRNVATIIQVGDTPLLEVGKFVEAGYTTRFPVFHADGTKIAVVKGCRIHLTEEGRSAKIKMRDKPDMYVCELEGQPILEMRRHGPAALKGWAELYSPTGVLVKALDSGVSAMLRGGQELQIAGQSVRNATFTDCAYGILIKENQFQIGFGGSITGGTFSGSGPIVITGSGSRIIGNRFGA